MNSDLDGALRQVAEEALETTAFMFVMEEEPGGLPPQAEAAVAAVPFDGPVCGTLVLAAAAEMLPELAGNMLGLAEDDAPPSSEQQHDAFKELANVICGNLLPRMAGREAVFDVEAPRLVEQEERDAVTRSREPAAQLHIDLDCGWANLALYLCQAAADDETVA
jgi:CheY-specific phosphatase CheX